MSKRGWDEEPNDRYAELRETLAWKILFPLNPYPNALRLGSGGESDEDFWLQCVRGSEGLGVEWKHTPLGGKETSFAITRAARVPYLVKNNSGKHFLDHVLVGYSKRETISGTPPVHAWGGPATQGHSSNPRYPNLAMLGTFLIEDLWPRDAGLIRRVENWQEPGGTYGYEESAVYDEKTPPWPFRELSIKPEKSVVIFMVGKVGAVYTKWALLVGYEGGGAW